MIKALELNKEEMEILLKNMPDSIRKKLMDLATPDSGISYLKEFVEKYEDDHMIDHLTAHALSHCLRHITKSAYTLEKERKAEKKPKLNTVEMGYVMINSLRHEADSIEKALEEHEQECTRGKDCGAKH